MAVRHNVPELCNRMKVIYGDKLDFKEDFFDLVICESVLDSMTFNIAKKIIKEINRVAKSFVFISLISGDDNNHSKEFAGEEVVQTEHEEGTIQSFFNRDKIKQLLENTSFSIIWSSLVTEESLISNCKSGRYYLVLEKIK